MNNNKIFIITAVASALLFLGFYQSVAYGQEASSSSSSSAAVTATAEPALVSNETTFLGSDILASFTSGLYSSHIENLTFYENGSAIAVLENPNYPEDDFEIHYNHTVTPDYGYRYENGSIIYEPTGKEVQIILEGE